MKNRMNHTGKWQLTGISICLAGSFMLGYVRSKQDSSGRIAILEAGLRDARNREEEAIVVKRVSKQMEEIAYQQKEISDRQRRNAEMQAEENYRMKIRVEEEWERAVKAQQETEKAYHLADRQKELAEERQHQAEEARKVAETLAYQTLGRSLGSLAATQFQTGNREIASLLAYSSSLFVQRYGGDLFAPSVFNALSLCSGQPTVWQRHEGGISSFVWKSRNGKEFYTLGQYGEVLLWKETTGTDYEVQVLSANPQHDFRDAFTDAGGTLYALSYDGELLTFSGGKCESRTTGRKACLRILPDENGDIWLLTAEGRIRNLTTLHTCPVTEVTAAVKDGKRLLIGRKNGDLLQVELASKKETPMGNFHPAPITAIACCRNNGRIAIGYQDGTLLLTSQDGMPVQKLVGHRSAVTGILFGNGKLYSCSNDRTLRLWNLTQERTESVTALESAAWLQSLALSPDNQTLFAGDGNGNLYRLSVSPEEMTAAVRQQLTRDFTQEEWLYYIGEGIPYETYTTKTP